MIDFLNLNNIDFFENEPLKNRSSFKIGGNAKYAIFPKNKNELIAVISKVKDLGIKYRVIGNASNILFDDKGFDGAIIFTKSMCDCEYVHKNGSTLIYAECGKSLTELSSEAGKKHALTGLEFAYGIPGTFGGAIYMNAGAYGGEMSDIVVETEYYDTLSGEVRRIGNHEHDFSYRHSIFVTHPEYIIISSSIELKTGDAEQIFAKMTKNMNSRKEKQPLEYPSCGSTFKRPEGNFAGKLIEDAGLKGYSVGGAEVSEKHAGFVINKNRATCSDVLNLIEHIKAVVFEKFKVMLECEVIYIPYNQ